jgi:hypothetical protein
MDSSTSEGLLYVVGAEDLVHRTIQDCCKPVDRRYVVLNTFTVIRPKTIPSQYSTLSLCYILIVKYLSSICTTQLQLFSIVHTCFIAN